VAATAAALGITTMLVASGGVVTGTAMTMMTLMTKMAMVLGVMIAIVVGWMGAASFCHYHGRCLGDITITKLHHCFGQSKPFCNGLPQANWKQP